MSRTWHSQAMPLWLEATPRLHLDPTGKGLNQADERTRTLDLLHGKSCQTSRHATSLNPYRFQPCGFPATAAVGTRIQHERFDRLCCVCHTADRSGLSSEEDAVELTRLGARQPRLGKQFDHLICKFSLLSWKRRRVAVVPAEPGTNVCVEPHLLARDFVGNPVELLHLLEQGLELIVVDGHVRSDASVRDEALAFQPLARFSGSRRSRRRRLESSGVRLCELRRHAELARRAYRAEGDHLGGCVAVVGVPAKERDPACRVLAQAPAFRAPHHVGAGAYKPVSDEMPPLHALARWKRVELAAGSPVGGGFRLENLPPAASAGQSQISTEYAI
jgi:hypothetical protein